MNRTRAAVLAGSAALVAVATAAPAVQATPTRPAPLDPPTGHRLVATVQVGDGVQVYECLANTDGTAGSTWRGRPVATLVQPRRGREVVGTHDSVSNQGSLPVPQWSSLADGSRVVGKLAQAFPAPDPTKAIAALRLDVTQNSGVGWLAPVTVIQRDLVRGGVGPSGACAPGDAPVVSGYGARYTFWAPIDSPSAPR